MIIVKLKGGLGNQLFQYAAGKSLAIKNKGKVKVDLSGFDKDELRKLELENLGIELSPASNVEIKQLKPSSLFSKVRNRLLPYSKKTFYSEPHFHFDRNFFSLGNDVYINGYFQSSKYFAHIENTIRDEFKTKDELVDQVKDLAQQLHQQNSVSIHIRRSDYKNKESNNYHGILTSEYYNSAIQLLKNKLNQPYFYIFSDDPQINYADLNLENATLVSGKKSSTHFEDFYLMSKCRHNIIANSSFSWWAAWLNNNPEKIVIAPKKWFNEGPKDTQDLLPESWITI